MTRASAAALLAALISSGAAAQSPAAGPPELEEVVVTAQRVQESAQTVPLSITVLNAKALEQQGVTTAADLQKLAPGLHVGGGAYKQYYVRGVGSVNITSLTDSTVAVNLDGVYISRPSSTNGLYYDLNRIEVLKGPQGTLYGRNATAGAINIITNKPVIGAFEGAVGVEFGNYEQRRFWGAANIPVNDKVALRAAFQTERHDGYFSDGTGDQDSKAARLSVKVVPNDDLSIVLVSDYDRERGVGAGGTLVPYIDADDPYLGVGDPRIGRIFSQTLFFPAGDFFTPLTFKPFLRAEYWGVSSEIEWRSPLGSLVLVPAYRRSSMNDRTNATGIDWNEDGSDRQFSMEGRLVSPSDQRLRWIVGGYYLDEKTDSFAHYNTGFLIAQPDFETTLRSKAAFGRVTYSASETFRISAGLRYTRETKTLRGTQVSGNVYCPAALFSGQALGCLGGFHFPYEPYYLPPELHQSIAQNGAFVPVGSVGSVVSGNVLTQDSRSTFDKLTWHAGVEWDIAPHSMAYVNVDTGFKAGGAFFSHDANSYKPEELTAYAIGVKNTFFGNRLRLNAEAFYWKYNQQQISYLTLDSTRTVFITTQNVGKSSYKGAELEAQAALGPSTVIRADLQYLDSVYKEFTYRVPNFGAPPFQGCPYTPGGDLYTIDCSGRPGINAPKWTFSVGAEQSFELPSDSGRLTLAANLRRQTGSYTNIDYIPEEYQGAYTTIDAQVIYAPRSGRWSITGFAKNLTDKATKSFTLANPSGNNTLEGAYLRPPRTYGVRLEHSF